MTYRDEDDALRHRVAALESTVQLKDLQQQELQQELAAARQELAARQAAAAAVRRRGRCCCWGSWGPGLRCWGT